MSLVLFNESLEIGGWLNNATQNITGNMFITAALVILLFLCIAALFRIPIMFFLIVTLPLIIVFALWDLTGGMMTFLMIVIILLGWALAKAIFAYR